MTTSPPTLVTLDSRGRVSFTKLARHSVYSAVVDDLGVITLTPVTVTPVTEYADTWDEMLAHYIWCLDGLRPDDALVPEPANSWARDQKKRYVVGDLSIGQVRKLEEIKGWSWGA